MTAVTYGAHTRVEAPVEAAPKGKGLLRRFYDALIAARLQQAQRELELHRHMLPGEYEIALDKVVLNKAAASEFEATRQLGR